MLAFDIRTLESHAVSVDDDLPADDPVWGDADTRPLGSVHVEGRLSAAGDDRFYFTGRISGQVDMECRRCLTDLTVNVDEEAQFLFAPAGDAETEDDPDVFIYEPGARELDIKPAVRESWLLDVPPFAQCREDCKGLCLKCGADLNAGACGCAAETIDDSWEPLSNPHGDFPPLKT